MKSFAAFVISLIVFPAIILISDFGVSPIAAEEKLYPNCKIHVENGETTADCSGLNLKSVPTSLPADVTKLNVSRNVISDVVTGTPLRQYGLLKVVDLSFNVLLEMDWRGFPDAVQQLDLSHNSLTDVCLHKGTSLSPSNEPVLPHLEEIRLDHNNVSTLTEGCFQHLSTSLKSVNLSANYLTTILNNTFQGLGQLTTLALGNNSIASLELEALAWLNQLNALSLEFNLLDGSRSSLPPGVFRPVGATLTTLYLHGNLIGRYFSFGHYLKEAMADLTGLETLRIDTFRNATFGVGFEAMRRLRVLDLSYNCQLGRITNHTFAAFANSSLQTLVLTDCRHILPIEPCAFCHMRNLTNLYLDRAQSPFRLDSLLTSFYAFRQHQEVQTVSAHYLAGFKGREPGFHLTAHSMRYVHDTCVRELILSRNYIVSVESGALYKKGSRFTDCIQRIDLSYNTILIINFNQILRWMRIPQLRSFEIQQQKTFSLEDALEVTNKVRDISYDTAERDHSYEINLTLSSTLEFVNMSGSFHRLGKFPQQVNLLNSTGLKVIDISYNAFIGCSSVIKGVENVETIDISGVDCLNGSATFFRSFSSLKTLIMKKMTLSPMEIFRNGKQCFTNLTLLENLDMSFNNLEHLSHDMLSPTKSLQQILLRGNNLESLDLDLEPLENLTLLDLSRNRLSVLSEGECKMLDRLVARQRDPLHLRLQGNPLACTCKTLDFVRWLMETRVVLDNDGDYQCVTDSGQLTSTRTVGRQWMNVWRGCVGLTVLWSAVAGMLVLMSLTGAVWGVAKNITRLHFWYSVIRRVRMPDRKQFARDAYIAYCDADIDFVCERLKTELNDKRNLRLLIKDLPSNAAGTEFYQYPGDNVALNILEHIDMSWKVVLVLTLALTRDPMAGFMTRAVLGSITDRMPCRVLLLCVGVHVPELTSVQALLETVPESQVFYLPHCGQRDPRLWDNMAQIILQ